MTLTVGSLFSGVGGLDLGLEQAGMQTAWQVEYDDWCREQLNYLFPHSKKYKDVKEVGSHNLCKVDVIAGGFPCQDVSIANQNGAKGLDGERSGLWGEYFRIIRELRPRYALIENVAKLAVFGLDRVLSDLASIGYDAEWQTIRAKDFNLPHERKRLFIIAYTRSVRPRIWNQQIYSGTNRKVSREGRSNSIGLPFNLFGRSYIEIPEHLRMDNGVSYELSEIKNAVKAYGNAVAPPVAKFLGEQIIKHYESN